MQLLGQIQNERAARALSDYLVTQNIQHDVHPVKLDENGSIQLFQFFAAESVAAKAQRIFDEFVENPNQSKYLAASWQAGVTEGVSPQTLGLNKIWQGAGRFTQVITVICAGLFIAALMGFGPAYYQQLSFSFDLSQPYRLLTPILMHGSVLHILFNLSWWWYLGGRVEKTLGWQSLIIITLISGLVSNIAQAVLVGSNFVGLSGVVYALAGFTWFCGRFHGSKYLSLPNNIFIFLLIWMALGFAEVLPVRMANWAHLGGLLSGMALAYFMVKPKTSAKKDDL